MRFLYSTIRFVPDPARGEFINVGAVTGSEESSEWKLRLVDNMKRARAIDEHDMLPAVYRFADNLSRLIEAHEAAIEASSGRVPELSEAWLNTVWEDSRNIVQISRPRPISAESADQALDVIFEELVVDPETRKQPASSKHSVLKAARDAYRREGIKVGSNLAEHREVAGPNHQQRFDFVVANGQVVQLVQAWSFQLHRQSELAEDIKSWAWSVEDMRSGGGRLDPELGLSLAVPKDVSIAAVYTPPGPDQPNQVFREAMSAFEKVKVTAVPVDKVDDVAKTAHILLAEAGVPLDDVRIQTELY